MLYTRKGDNGTTKLFDSRQGTRVSKADLIFDVLGAVDELNSSIGYAKALACKSKDVLSIQARRVPYTEILETFQQGLFLIQAELGGSGMHIGCEHTRYLELVVHEVETVLPPVTSFVVAGGGETGAYLDVVRAIARRAERYLVLLSSKKDSVVDSESIVFMNRLSSALYALARFANYQEGHSETTPTYA